MPKRIGEQERFWNKVDKSGPDCWNWTGMTNGGYGHFRPTRSTKIYAHRYAYRELVDLTFPLNASKDKSLPLFILHSCDNRKCCNPTHMTLGSYNDNIQDMKAKGRNKRMRGEDNPRAKLTSVIADSIRLRALAGESLSALGREFSVTPQAIWGIKEGRLWA